jgi:hypothetical protein
MLLEKLRCLLWDWYKKHKCILWEKCSVCEYWSCWLIYFLLDDYRLVVDRRFAPQWPGVLSWRERKLLVAPPIPDRWKGRDQLKCSLRYSRLGVGRAAPSCKKILLRTFQSSWRRSMEGAKTHTHTHTHTHTQRIVAPIWKRKLRYVQIVSGSLTRWRSCADILNNFLTSPCRCELQNKTYRCTLV